MAFLISNSTIIEYLTIFDVSNLDIACTNKKIRNFILLLFRNAIIYINLSLNNNYNYLFKCVLFLEYIRTRRLYITNWDILNNLTYFLDKLQYNYVTALNILEYNISLSQLSFIINNFNKLSSLSLGDFKNNEIFYNMFSSSIPPTIKIIMDMADSKITNYLELENIYMLCSDLPYDFCLQLINMSPKLKKIQIRTIDKNFSKLIIEAIQHTNIKYIEIYDKNTSIETILEIISKLNCVGLRINVQGYNHILDTQTIISFFTKNITINCIIHHIIKMEEIAQIFQLCPNLTELSIEEDIDGDMENFDYLFLGALTFPPLLESIYIDVFNSDVIINIITKIVKIKYIYIEFIFDFEIEELNNLKKKYKLIQFITMKIA